MSDTLRRIALTPLGGTPAERAARPSPSVTASNKYPEEMPVTEMTENPIQLADLTAEEKAGALGRLLEQLGAPPETVAAYAPASAPQQDVLAGVPAGAVSAAGGYTKTRLGTVVLVGNVGHSKNILYKTVGGKSLVEFSFAARTLGHTEPTWYRATLWGGAEADLELIRQGTYVQLKGQAVQSQSHRTGKLFLDVTVARIAAGPEKGAPLAVAASRAQAPAAPKGYLARLWDALRGR